MPTRIYGEKERIASVLLNAPGAPIRGWAYDYLMHESIQFLNFLEEKYLGGGADDASK